MTVQVARVRRGAGYGVVGYGVAAAALVCLGLSACTPEAPETGSSTAGAMTGVTAGATANAGASTPVTAYPEAVTDEQVLETVAAMDAALQAGDVDAFLAHVSPELAEQQRAWFEAVRNVPMDVRQLRADKVVSRSSPTGTVLHVALRHLVTGAGPVPVLEQYRWVLAPDADGSVRLVDVTGRNGTFHGYPQPWDLGAVAVLQADDVVLLAPEEARTEAEELLPDISRAAQELRRDFPALARSREVLHVQLAGATDLARMLDAEEDEYWMGTSWLRTSTEDPLSERPWLGPEEETLDHRLLLDLDVAVMDRELYDTSRGGNTSVRHLGAYAAVVGDRDLRDPVGWLLEGVPTWYELAGDPALEEYLLSIAVGAHVDGPPEALPAPHPDPEQEDEGLGYYLAATSLLTHLDETYGREATLEVVDRLHDVSAWYEENQIWPLVVETLGTDEERLLAGWQEWGEELLTRVEPFEPDAEEG